MGTVKVVCRVPGGLKIKLFKKGFDDGTGDNVTTSVLDGPPVTLNGPPAGFASGVNSAHGSHDPAITEVDEGWMTKWMEQNKQNPFVQQSEIYMVPNG
jgi:hypothetical protein